MNPDFPREASSNGGGANFDRSPRFPLEEVFAWVLRNLGFLLLGPVLGLCLGFLAQRLMTTVYQSKGNFIVNDLPFGPNSGGTDAETERILVQTLILSIPSTDMLHAVAKRTGADPKRFAFTDVDRPVSLNGSLPAANIRIESPRNSRLGAIEATSQDPEFAAATVNAILDELLHFNRIGGKLRNVKSSLDFAKNKADSLLKQLLELSGARLKLERENSELGDYIKRGFPLQSFPAFNDDATLSNLKTQLILIQSQYDSIASSSTRGAQFLGKRSELLGLKQQIAAHSQSLAGALKAQLEITSTQEKNIQKELEETQARIGELEQFSARLVQSFGDLSLTPGDLEGGAGESADNSSNVIVVIERASPQNRPVRPKLLLNLALGLVFGTGLGIAIAVLRTWTDRKLRSLERVERLTGLPCLALLPRLAPLATGRRSGGVSSKSSVGIGFLRSRLLRDTLGGRSQIIGFTPSRTGRDCSQLVADLAILLAQAEKRTLIVDLHLGSPRQTKMLGIDGSRGLGEWLVADDPLSSYINYSTIRELAVLAPGQIGEGLDDLLSRRAFSEALVELLCQWDFILLDSPCVLSDWSMMLSLPARSPLIVAAEYKSPADEVTRTADHARASKWEVLGVVLQNCPEHAVKPYLKSP